MTAVDAGTVQEAGHRRRTTARWWTVGSVAVAAAGTVGLLFGAVHVAPATIARWAWNAVPFVDDDASLSPTQSVVLSQIRLPRVVLGAIVGGALASSGAAYQAVFRNPLADPYLLGAASGAGLGVTIALVTGHGGNGGALPVLPLAAFVGALVSVGLAYRLGTSRAGGRTSTSLVLAGIAVASFFTATQTFVQQQNADTVRQVYTWILGRLSTAGWREVMLVSPYAAVSLITLLAHRRILDVLALGDEEAQSLGISVRRCRAIIVLAASLGTAAAVAASGLIAFVGIIVPHFVRALAGGSYRLVIGLSLAFGAAFLVLVDVVARTIVAPGELPIGVITAFVGAPLFALAIRRSDRGRV
jgi:iron complex transport system permease protein